MWLHVVGAARLHHVADRDWQSHAVAAAAAVVVVVIDRADAISH